MSNKTKKSKKKLNKKNNTKTNNQNNKNYQFMLIPVSLLLALSPIILRFTEHSTGYNMLSSYNGYERYTDIFLFGKAYFVLIIAIIMLIMGIYVYIKSNNTKLLLARRNYLIIAYTVLVLLSTFSAINRTAALSGEKDQVEPLYVLLSYVIIAVYVPIAVEYSKNLKPLLISLFCGSFIVSSIGILQATGIQPLDWGFIKHLYMSGSQIAGTEISLTNGIDGIASTLYNPNFVAPYVAMSLPVSLGVLCTKLKPLYKIAAGLLSAMLICILLASRSKAGILVIALLAIFVIIFCYKSIIQTKYKWIFIAAILLIPAGSITSLALSNNNILASLSDSQSYNIKGIDTLRDCVRISYKDSIYEFRFDPNDTYYPVLVTEDGESLTTPPASKANNYTPVFTTKYGDTILTPIMNNDCDGIFILGFNVEMDNKTFCFTNQAEPDNYQIFNQYHKLHESYMTHGIFKNNLSFATYRGYSWSQFIPVMWKYTAIGAGPDNYPYAISEADDYAFRYNVDKYKNAFYARPHNMYIQMWVNTGLLSLIAFLAYVGMYIVSCFRIYWERHLSSTLDIMGVACFIAVLGFLGCSMSTDSMVVTTPMYWCVISIGIAINKKNRNYNL